MGAELMAACVNALAVDELAEVAGFAISGFLLEDHRQIGLVELLEEGVPRDRLERRITGACRKVNPEQTGLLARTRRALNSCRLAAAFFGPAPNFIVVGCGFRIVRHCS